VALSMMDLAPPCFVIALQKESTPI